MCHPATGSSHVVTTRCYKLPQTHWFVHGSTVDIYSNKPFILTKRICKHTTRLIRSLSYTAPQPRELEFARLDASISLIHQQLSAVLGGYVKQTLLYLRELVCASSRRAMLRDSSPAYVSIRRHTAMLRDSSPAYVSIRRHTSAYVGIRQHTLARVRAIRRQHLIHEPRCAVVVACIRQHTSACVSIRQHTSAYVSIRQHTS
jgi:hypothetical protein